MNKLSIKSQRQPVTSNPVLSVILQVVIVLSFLAVIGTSIIKDVPHWIRYAIFAWAILLSSLQLIRLKSPILLVDRIFANYPVRQIYLAAFLFLVTFDFALCLFPNGGLRNAFIDFISPVVLYTNNAESYSFETDTINYVPNIDDITVIKHPGIAKPRSEYIRHSIVYILGLLIFNGLLIATINRFMATRAERYKRGVNTYRSIKNHDIIIGYGIECVPIIRNVLKKERLDNSFHFLVLSDQDPETIRRSILTQFQSIEERIIIYSGNMDSVSQLNRLNIGKAKEVFILGEQKGAGRDSKNLECAKKIKEIRQETPNSSILPIHVQLDKPSSYSTIKRITIPQNYFKDENNKLITYIRPFSFYENWARLLWGYYRLDEYMPLDRNVMDKDGHHVHLVIAGFNEMGAALLLEALRICHYPNYNETTRANKTTITVIDPKMDELLPRFQSQFPYLNQIVDVDIEYKKCDLEDKEIRLYMEQLAQQEDTLLTVAICFYDSDSSFSAALCLPDDLYYLVDNNQLVPNPRTQILVRQEIRSGLANLLDEENGKYANVKVFGTLDKGVDDELLNDAMAIIINAHYHFKYGLGYEKNFFQLMEEDKENTMEEAMHDWMSLNEDKRFANRYQTEIYKSYQTYREILEKDPEILYQTEHMRWCAERSITGYRDLHELNVKSEKYQVHKSIIPYHELSRFEKDKDKDVLLVMDQVIALSKKLGMEFTKYS